MKTGKCLGLLLLALLAVSCAKITLPGEGLAFVPAEDLPTANQIPAEYGKLVSVNNNTRLEYMVELWFESDEGVVRLVLYDKRTSTLSKAFVINRS